MALLQALLRLLDHTHLLFIDQQNKLDLEIDLKQKQILQLVGVFKVELMLKGSIVVWTLFLGIVLQHRLQMLYLF